MSITISTAPTGVSAAFRPVIFEVSSDRYSALVTSIVAVASGTGGKVRYTVASHSYKVGDVIQGSTFTGISVVYNIKQTVTVLVNSTHFETDIDFVASATGAGVVTRLNENFQMKCETYCFDSVEIAITSVVDDSGFANLKVTSHPYVTGDLIFVRGTTSYNGVTKVLGYDATTIVVGLSFVSNQTGFSRLGRLVSTKRQQAITVSGSITFRFNCSGQLQSVLTPDYNDVEWGDIQTPCVNSIKVFAIKFIEEWDDVNGLLQEHDLIVSSGFYATRAVWQHKQTQNLSSYYISTGSSRFLTNAPSVKHIRIGEEEQLHFISNGNQSVKVGIFKFDLGGNPFGSVEYLTVIDIIDNKGIIPINSNIFDNTLSKFIIGLFDSGNNFKSEFRTFIIDYNKYQNAKRFYFENTLGGFDAFTFTGNLSRTGNSAKTGFKKTLGLNYAISDRGQSDIANSNTISNEIFSGFLTNAEALWLNELLQSTNVFTKEIGDNISTPVNILSDSQPIYDPNFTTQIKLVYAESNIPLGLNN